MSKKQSKYINIADFINDGFATTFILGARGVGKTIGAFVYMINQFKETGAKGIYLRRYQIEVEKAGIDAGLLSELTGSEITRETIEIEAVAYDFILVDGEPAIYMLALNTLGKYKSSAFPGVNIIIYDEFIDCNEYDVEFHFVDGVKFVKTLYRPFDNFIQYHAKNKIKASREHNKELKFVSKVCLNSSYGKLGERFHDTESTLVNIDDEPIYIDEPVDKDWEQKGNIVIASFITAYARFNLYEQAKKIMDHDATTLNYVDTDSIHFSYHGLHRPEIDSFIKKIRNNEDYNKDKLEQTFIKICDEIGVEYDPAEFGKWKIEGFFDKCVYLDAKRYIENDLFIGDNIKVAGVQQVGREYLKKKGMKYFMYARDKNIVVPFVMLKRVYGGYKFINSYKLLTPQANANGYII